MQNGDPFQKHNSTDFHGKILLSAETLQSVTDRGSLTNSLISVAKDNVLDPNLYARGNFEARGASAPSYGFQIPGTDGLALYYPGAQQYYQMKLSLGGDYTGTTGTDNGFAMQLAIPRTPQGGNPYMSVRYLEGGAWGSWSKIWSGYADQTGSVANDAASIRFHWSGQNGQPTWLWGGDGASDMYVYNPSNFSVKNADNLGNISEQGFARAGVKEGGPDWNSLTDRTFIGSIGGSVNGPINNGNWWNIINTRHRNGSADGSLYGLQIAQGMTADNDRIFFRSQNTGTWYP